MDRHARLHRHVVRLTGGAPGGGPTTEHLAEALAELLRREVVDDGVDARVEVGETVPQDAHALVDVGLGQAAKVGDEQVDVHGQPEEREDDDDEDDESARLPLLVLRLRLLVDHRRPLPLDVVQDED